MNRIVIEKVPIKKILDGWLPVFGLTNFQTRWQEKTVMSFKALEL